MKVKTTYASLSHFLQKHNENCLKYDKTEKKTFRKIVFRFFQLLFSEKCIQKSSVLAPKTCSYFFFV